MCGNNWFLAKRLCPVVLFHCGTFGRFADGRGCTFVQAWLPVQRAPFLLVVVASSAPGAEAVTPAGGARANVGSSGCVRLVGVAPQRVALLRSPCRFAQFCRVAPRRGVCQRLHICFKCGCQSSEAGGIGIVSVGGGGGSPGGQCSCRTCAFGPVRQPAGGGRPATEP